VGLHKYFTLCNREQILATALVEIRVCNRPERFVIDIHDLEERSQGHNEEGKQRKQQTNDFCPQRETVLFVGGAFEVEYCECRDALRTRSIEKLVCWSWTRNSPR
jgi:hypothetical protein